ncbi:MAG: hypothetical protein DLM58_05660 [Pseudonocardiales bacterium]|nr:MAG: hypothetical protein DLM58_05660 [Pseudonocardiales bacterium]
MDSLQIALILSERANAEIHSALPHAPTVEHIETVPAFARTRKAIAGALRHAADAVAPVPAGRSALR